MKKLMGLFLVALCAGNSFGENVRIALLGNDNTARNIADLVLAKGSETCIFVERGEVLQFQREQRLLTDFPGETLARQSKVLGADLFAVLETGPSGTMQLTVFESDCGFRLCRRKLPSDPQAAAEMAMDQLQAAAERTSKPGNWRVISVAGVRNNLHYSLQAQGSQLANAILDWLAEQNVILLERDYLIELLREAELSDRWEQAVTAGEILHIELNPGATAQDFNVEVYITAPDDQIVFRQGADAGNPTATTKLRDALADHLNQPTSSGTFDRHSEAARFAREAEYAQQEGNSLEYLKKGFAAYALDPDNPARLSGIPISTVGDVNRSYPYWRAALLRMKGSTDFQIRTSAQNILMAIQFNHESQLSDSNRADFKSLLTELREWLLSDPEEADFALDHAIGRFCRIRRPLFADDMEFQSARFAALETVWSTLEDTIRQPPETMEQKHFQWLLSYQIYECTSNLFDIQAGLSPDQLVQWTQTTVDRIDHFGVAELQPLAVILKLNCLLYDKQYTDARAIALLDDYFRLSSEAGAGLPGNCLYYSSLLQQRPQLWDHLLRRLKSPDAPSPQTASQPVTTDQQTPASEPDLSDIPVLASYRSNGNTTYVLSYDDFDYQILRVDPDGSRTAVGHFPQQQNDNPAAAIPWFLQLESGTMAAANPDKVYIGTGEKQRLYPIDHFNFPIRGIFLLGNRIAIYGDHELISCDYTGKDRVVLVSNAQEEKMLPPQQDNPTITICQAQADTENDGHILIAFRNNDNSMDWWRINPEQQTAEKVQSVP